MRAVVWTRPGRGTALLCGAPSRPLAGGHAATARLGALRVRGGNIYRADRATYVVDWEGGEGGLPLCDLLYLILYWTYDVRRLAGETAQLQGFRDLFCRLGSADAAIAAGRATIADYMARLEIDRRFFPLLLVLLWVVHAISRVDREETLGAPGPGLRAGNVYVRYIAALAEHAGPLFAEYR